LRCESHLHRKGDDHVAEGIANTCGNEVMDSSFYRTQAELCLRIGRTLPHERIAEELLELAAEYEAKAAEIESVLSQNAALRLTQL
jgi:hypothetical protein